MREGNAASPPHDRKAVDAAVSSQQKRPTRLAPGASRASLQRSPTDRPRQQLGQGSGGSHRRIPPAGPSAGAGHHAPTGNRAGHHAPTGHTAQGAQGAQGGALRSYQQNGNNYVRHQQFRNPVPTPQQHDQNHDNGNEKLWEETMVHFHKSFGVMQELFDHRDFATLREDLQTCAFQAAMPVGGPPMPRFLDLGCAPGGFSACLMQDSIMGPTSSGLGVSLPPELGGFHMTFSSDRLYLQLQDLMTLQVPDLCLADDSVDICVADAQYLSNFKNLKNLTNQYRGVRVRSKTLGIWALTVKECQLAFAKLRRGGAFIFRFGWRGIGSTDTHASGEKVESALLARYVQEEEWYKALTHWLFSVLKSLFIKLRPFKSEYAHQADVSFYMTARGFDRRKYIAAGWEAKLQRAYDALIACEDEASLVGNLSSAIAEDTKAEIDEMLDYVGKMRAIGIGTRKVTNPKFFKEWNNNGASWNKGQKEEPQKEKAHPSSLAAAADSSDNLQAPPSDASTVVEESGASASSCTVVTSDNSSRHDSEPMDLGVGSVLGASAAAAAISSPSTANATSSTKLCAATTRWGKGVSSTGENGNSRSSTDGRASGECCEQLPTADDGDIAVGKEDPCSPNIVVPDDGVSIEVNGSVSTPVKEVFDPEQEYRRKLHVQHFESQLHEQREQAEEAHMFQQEAARVAALQSFHSSLQDQHNSHDTEFAGHSVGWAHQPPMSMSHSFSLHEAEPLVWIPTDSIPLHSEISSRAVGMQLSHDCNSKESVVLNNGSPWATSWPNPDCEPWSAPETRNDASTLVSSVPAEQEVEASSSKDSPIHSEGKDPPIRSEGKDPPIPSEGKDPCISQKEPCDKAPASSSNSGRSILPPRQPSRKSETVMQDGGKKTGSSDIRRPPAKSKDKDNVVFDDGSDSLSSDEDGGGNGEYQQGGVRHKRRAGRRVRERRSGVRGTANDDAVDGSGGDRTRRRHTFSGRLLRARRIALEYVQDLVEDDFLVHALRIGLFCAMAWSLNSIIFSIMKICRGESLLVPD